MKQKAYAAAGVDVDLGNRVKAGLGGILQRTHRPEVLGRAGGFGGLFRASFPRLKDPVLVASVDGVGTKLKLAFALDKHDTVGADLVNHCIDDILTLGAEPLFFLDYIGTEKLRPRVFAQLIDGFTRACAAANCALIGGETAQLPGMYHPGEYDLAGTIVGVVDRRKLIDGSTVRPGDQIVALPSSGLHTNGYTLARKLVFETLKLKPGSHVKGLRGTIGAELLREHRSYLPEVRALLRRVTVRGMAHITGGGLLDNVPRVLPASCDAVFDLASWIVPPLFRLLVDAGKLPRDEAFQVFNMGVGYIIIVRPADLRTAMKLTGGWHIGHIEAGTRRVRLINAD
jgi:phosphoribosylformylglycinamidine cyclo-ligase